MKNGMPLSRLMGLQSVIVAIVPLILVAALLWLLVIPGIRDEVGVRHQVLASSISGRITTYLQGAEHELLALADYIVSRGTQPQSYWSNLLDTHVGEGDIYEAMYIATSSGSVTAVGLPLKRRSRRIDLIGLDLSRRPFFREAKSNHNITWSETFLSTISERLAVALAIPIEEKVLIAEIAIDRLSDFISFMPGKADFLIMITDDRGKVISDSAHAFGGQSLDPNQVPIMHKGLTEELGTKNFQLGHAQYICTVVTVDKFGWKVLVAQRSQEAFRQVTATLWMVGTGILLALALAVAASWFLARSFSRYFRRFVRQAQAISSGDYDQPWPESGITEFARFRGHLQNMAAAIQTREKELFANEAKYHSVVSNAPVIIAQFDSDGIITLFEGQGLFLLGMQAGAVEGRSWFDLHRENDDLCENARKAIAGKEIKFASQIGKRFFDIHFTPIHQENGPRSVLCVGVDITARVKADKALQENVYLLKESQKTARLGHYTLDKATGSWESSEVLDDILGIGASFPKTMAGWMSIIHPEDREMVVSHLSDDDMPENQLFNQEFRIIRQTDQAERWVHGHSRLESIAQGTRSRVIGIIQDITEKKQLEGQLLQAQKMDAIGQLAGGVAHDFNNMLGVIIGYVELIKAGEPEDTAMMQNIMQIEHAAIRSRDITRQLLAFSRKQIIVPELADLNHLIEDTVKTLTRLIGENIHLLYIPQKELWKIKVDPAQMNQILVNLAVNARDAMPNGGKMTIETGNVHLDEAYCRLNVEAIPGPYVQLAVSDSGSGIEKDAMSHIFEPFFTTKSIGEGTGLGLATVYGIAKQNGGFINVYSEPGEGTTFKVYFPRVEEDEVGLKEVVKEPMPESVSGTVLLVEDDEMVRKVSASMLKKLGYTVMLAETPSIALSICQDMNEQIDLLMTDVVMPEMSGKELSDRVKKVRPNMKVLFMSGYTSNVIVHHGVLEEGVQFAQKPFSLRELGEKVRDAISVG